MNIIEMAGQPGTPGTERLRLAQTIIHDDLMLQQQDPNHRSPWKEPTELNTFHRDVRMLLDYREIYFFSMEARDELTRLADAEQINNNMDILPFVVRGSDHRFIGIIIDLADPREKPLKDQEDGLIVTRLYRDPEWVGFNDQLKWCRDLEVHVFAYKGEPEEPDVIIATRPGGLEGTPADDQNLSGLNEAIRDTVLWHGALSCTFHNDDQ